MNELPKIPPTVWDEDSLEVFERKHEMEIRSLAPGLEMEEILEYYGIDSIDLLPDYDRWFFEVTWKRGRILAKQNAAAALIKALEGKGAIDASLHYLTRFGNDNWKMDSASGFKTPKSIRIVMDE